MLRSIIIYFLLTISVACNAQLKDQVIHDLKSRRIVDDTSHIYTLPYAVGRRVLFVQGANSRFSHKNELSFDFKMKIGTAVCAARGGKVIEIKEDSQVGGLDSKYYNAGNHIIIEHDDGSTAVYWHLRHNGVLIKLGDQIKQGQTIGLSGNTGYSAFPHLHFQVKNRFGMEILPRFSTSEEVRYLRPGRWYKRPSASK